MEFDVGRNLKVHTVLVASSTDQLVARPGISFAGSSRFERSQLTSAS
jgi:hypothetical protein